LAVGFCPLPVSPPLNDGLDDGPLEEPLPPHAARARSPTEDRATNGVLSLMCAPFADSSTRRDSPSGAPGPARPGFSWRRGHDPGTKRTSRTSPSNIGWITNGYRLEMSR